MIAVRQWVPLGLVFALGACVVAPPPGYVAEPGQGKDAAAFQRDDEACHKQADAQLAPAPVSSSPSAAASSQAPAVDQAGDQLSDPGATYAQCMAARGNTVTRAAGYPAYDYAYAYPYPYAYPYAYPYYPYPAYYGGPVVSFGFGFGGRGYYHGYRH